MENDVAWIGRRIADRRKSLGLTQAQLSRLSGIANSSISVIETGKQSASMRTLERLADAMAIDVAALIYPEAHELTGPLTVEWALGRPLEQFTREIEDAPLEWLLDLEIRFNEAYEHANRMLGRDMPPTPRMARIAEYSLALMPEFVHVHKKRFEKTRAEVVA